MALRLASATVSTANTNTDGTGTITDVATGTSAGTRIDYVTITATSSTTNGMIRLWTYNGTNWRLLAEIPVFTTTASATTAKWTTVFRLPALYLGATQKLGITTQIAESFHIVAMCTDM